KPAGSHDLALVSVPGHPEGREHVSTLVAAPHTRPLTRQPRFAITAVKLREAFQHRWKLALLVGLVLAAVGGGLAVLTYQPKYTAVAILRMHSSGARLFSRGPEAEYREEEFRKTQAHLIKSPYVLDKVLSKPSIQRLKTIREADNPNIWLEKELKAISVTGT